MTLNRDHSKPDGFKNKRERKAFAKLLVISTAYHDGSDWDDDVKIEIMEHCNREAKRLGFMLDWRRYGSYDDLKEAFIKHYRKTTPQ